jgi:hypothetical protein
VKPFSDIENVKTVAEDNQTNENNHRTNSSTISA